MELVGADSSQSKREGKQSKRAADGAKLRLHKHRIAIGMKTKQM